MKQKPHLSPGVVGLKLIEPLANEQNCNRIELNSEVLSLLLEELMLPSVYTNINSLVVYIKSPK